MSNFADVQYCINADIVDGWVRNIHIECSKQVKWNSYFQALRKVCKSGGGACSTMVGIICPPSWDRVNCLAQPPVCDRTSLLYGHPIFSESEALLFTNRVSEIISSKQYKIFVVTSKYLHSFWEFSDLICYKFFRNFICISFPRIWTFYS